MKSREGLTQLLKYLIIATVTACRDGYYMIWSVTSYAKVRKSIHNMTIKARLMNTSIAKKLKRENNQLKVQLQCQTVVNALCYII